MIKQRCENCTKKGTTWGRDKTNGNKTLLCTECAKTQKHWFKED